MALASLVSFQDQKQDQKHKYCIRYAHAFLKSKSSNTSLVGTR